MSSFVFAAGILISVTQDGQNLRAVLFPALLSAR
jgi:hypothetical protein